MSGSEAINGECHMTELPTGTVTFLFTDIEGSTRLLRQLGDKYADVLSEHRRILRAVVQDNGGREVDTQGDAFFIAFPRAADALLAAIAAQRAIATYRWPEDIALRVRMALHTGEPLSADTGYVGMDVHRAARICAAGHGGQILLSQTTRNLISGDPGDVQFRDLGEHRLKDVADAQHLFQVVAADLPAEFPQLKSLSNLSHNLPVQLTSFIGREFEVAEVGRLLTTTPLLTLVGFGGVGKTRLAVQVAAEVLDQYRDGVWLVELAALADPGFVPKMVASTLGVPEQAGRPLPEMLAESLSGKTLLLVLDNCEHLLSACVDLADALLKRCPWLRILATSREALGIAGELTYPVPPLCVLAPDGLLTPDIAMECESVRLFVERAVLSKPGFRLTSYNAAAVAQIASRLDGIPLAIELAAARVKVLDVEQIARRLDDRFHLLTGGGRNALPRQKTLQGAMDWSYDLLGEAERTVLRRLSAFPGGCVLEAAEAVCSGNGVEITEVLDLLTQLVDKSVVIVEAKMGEARYRLLETVRQYGRDRLREAGEDTETAARHRDWFLALAEPAEEGLRGPAQQSWLKRLDAEHDNLRAALEWSKTVDGGAEGGLRIATALTYFWHLRGHIKEARKWLAALLSTATGAPASLRARALCAAGIIAWRLSEYGEASRWLEESLTLCAETQDTRTSGMALHFLAHVAKSTGDFDQAARRFEESLDQFNRLQDQWGRALSLSCLGSVVSRQGDYGRAKALLDESLALFTKVGDRLQAADALFSLAKIAEALGEYERAMQLAQESLEIGRTMGNRITIAAGLAAMGLAALRQGAVERAVALLRESLRLRTELADREGIASCLALLGAAALEQGQPSHAAWLIAAADTLRATIGAAIRPAGYDRDRLMSTLRNRLGEAEFELASAEGRAMSLDQAIQFALSPADQVVPDKAAHR